MKRYINDLYTKIFTYIHISYPSSDFMVSLRQQLFGVSATRHWTALWSSWIQAGVGRRTRYMYSLFFLYGKSNGPRKTNHIFGCTVGTLLDLVTHDVLDGESFLTFKIVSKMNMSYSVVYHVSVYPCIWYTPKTRFLKNLLVFAVFSRIQYGLFWSVACLSLC